MGILYGLVPEGRWRNTGKWMASGLVALVAVARMHLGVEAPTDVLVGDRGRGGDCRCSPSACSPRTRCSRSPTGAAAAPTSTSVGPAAQAIRRALEDQLGLDRRRRQAVRPGRLGRLDAAAHHRQGRARPRTVRQALRPQPPARRPLVQARPRAALRPARGREAVQHRAPARPAGGLRAVADAAGRPAQPDARTASSSSPRSGSTCWSPSSSTARPSSATPRSTTRSSTTASRIVRRLWDAGLAHRDIKPANLLVRDGRLLLIDVAFAEIRPTPWRQAVDLANMMLCLALRSEPRAGLPAGAAPVHRGRDHRGLRRRPGLALPSQLRRLLRDRGPRPARRVPDPAARPTPPDQHPTVERAPDRTAAAHRRRPARAHQDLQLRAGQQRRHHHHPRNRQRGLRWAGTALAASPIGALAPR